MKRYTSGISALFAIIVLSACVAIPENPPPTPAPRPQRDVSELASALAKMYAVDNADELHDRLTELKECLFHVMEGEIMPAPEESDTIAIHLVGEITLTPEEWDAMSIYVLSSLQAAARYERFEAVKDGTLDKYYDPDTESREEQVIQEFDWTRDIVCGE